jgi:hypothetical protein
MAQRRGGGKQMQVVVTQLPSRPAVGLSAVPAAVRLLELF